MTEVNLQKQCHHPPTKEILLEKLNDAVKAQLNNYNAQ